LLEEDHRVPQSFDFSGVWIPIVTPFRDQRVDTTALAALVRRLSGQGIAGFVVCATTGEAPLLDDAERDLVLATVRASSALPVVLGAAVEYGVRSLTET